MNSIKQNRKLGVILQYNHQQRVITLVNGAVRGDSALQYLIHLKKKAIYRLKEQPRGIT
jgi:hypothetical protein